MFPRDGKTASSRKDIWGIGTKWFPLARKSVSTSQNKGFVEKNKFTLGGNPSLPRVSEKWKTIGFHYPEHPFPLARMKDLFQKYIFNVWKIDKTMTYTSQIIRFD